MINNLQPRAPEGRPLKKLKTFEQSFVLALTAARSRTSSITFPATQFEHDPCAFAEQILGVRLWDMQRLILESILTHDRVSIRAASKLSKTHSSAILALFWAFGRRHDARVIFLAPTYRQTNGVLYRQIRQLIAQSGLCITCRELDPNMPRPCPHSACLWQHARVAELADTGVQCDDFRSIQGFSATDTSSLQGISAPAGSLLFILDEACFINDSIYHGVEGCTAGGSTILAISNPLVRYGWWADTWFKNAAYWHKIHLSALFSPNVKERRVVVSGLATAEYVERRKSEWGESSFNYVTRVLGEFAGEISGKMFPFDRVQQAIDRWDATPAEGPLRVGADVAGASQRADESCLAFVRGQKLIDLVTTRSLDTEQLVAWMLTHLERWRLPGEVPVLRLDVEGTIGAQTLGALRHQQKLTPNAFRLVAVSSSDKAHHNTKALGTVRDEMADALEKWLKNGGALIDDPLLLEELAVMEWLADNKGRNRLLPKSDIKAALGRSCDRFDAIALAMPDGSQDGAALIRRQVALRRQAAEPGKARNVQASRSFWSR